MKSWLEFKLWICLRSHITAANDFNRITIQFTLVTAQDRWYLLLYFFLLMQTCSYVAFVHFSMDFSDIRPDIYLPYGMTVAKVQGRHDLSEELPGFFGR